MRLLSLFFSLIICCQFTFAVELLSSKEFTQLYMQELESTYPKMKVINQGDLAVTYQNADGEEATSFLDNAYLQYKNSPDSKDNIIKIYISSIQPDPATPGRHNLLPMIRHKSYLKQLGPYDEQIFSNQQFPFYYEKFNEELYVLYVFDTELTMELATTETLTDLKIDLKTIRTVALENLVNSMSLSIRGDPSSFSMLRADGNYEASFILLSHIWNKEQFPVEGDIVIYLPSRDTVFITGSEDVESQKKIREIIDSPENEWPYMISNKGFIRKNDHWEVMSK